MSDRPDSAQESTDPGAPEGAAAESAAGMAPESGQAPPRKSPRSLLIVVIAFMALMLPYCAWKSSHFGPLTRKQIEERLNLEVDPREAQHALSQVVERLDKKDPEGEAFREQVVLLREHPRAEVRRMVAWTMGYDLYDGYHDALIELLEDQDKGVQRNAACALARFKDASGRPVLLEMLRPIEVKAPLSGELIDLDVKVDSAVSVGRSFGEIKDADGKKHKIRPPFNGFLIELSVKEGDPVAKEQVLGRVAPDSGMVEAALIALGLIGKREDREAVLVYSRDQIPGMPATTGQVARKVLGILDQR